MDYKAFAQQNAAEEFNLKPLVVICGWCPEARERTLQAQQAGYRVSHGMCPTCQVAFESLATEPRA